MRRHRVLLSFAVALATMIPATSAMGWKNGDDWGNGFGTHDWVFHEAYELARGGSSQRTDWLDYETARLASDDPDMVLFDWDHHHYDVWGECGGHAPAEIARLLGEIVALRDLGQYSEASARVGYLVHYYADICNPVHTDDGPLEPDMHGNHEAATQTRTDLADEHDDWIHPDGLSLVTDVEAMAVSAATDAHADYTTLVNAYLAGSFDATVEAITQRSLSRAVNDIADIIHTLDPATGTYRVERLQAGEQTEYRCHYRTVFEEQHFATLVLDKDDALAVRPHPGLDPNGWGTSPYIQPFLPGATLGHTTVQNVSAGPSGIAIACEGFVSREATETFGTWNLQLDLSYDLYAKRVCGAGEYTIDLADMLSETTGELNLMKLASNYLRNVPLLDGSTGDTGDMQYVHTVADDLEFTWIPWQQPAHYPTDLSENYDITAVGQYNQVDTESQGADPIDAAYKPTVRVALRSEAPGAGMMMGYAFDESKATEFGADNVAVTPLVPKSSPLQTLAFDIDYESTAIEPASIRRVAGVDRYATAVEASKTGFPSGAQTVVIATGENWPDALGGSALAGVLDAPLLLSRVDSLPDVTRAEIVRLAAAKVYILGGEGAVSDAVVQTLRTLPGILDVTQLEGRTRYETASKIADEVVALLGGSFSGTCLVARGDDYPDAMAGSPIAAAMRTPIVLARPDEAAPYVPPSTTDAIILGGHDAVSGAVEDWISVSMGADHVRRLAGETRYETAAAIASYGTEHGLSWGCLGLATGQDYPDALSGGTVLGALRGVLLLTPRTSLHQATGASVGANSGDINTVFVLGGVRAIPEEIEEQVRAVLDASHTVP